MDESVQGWSFLVARGRRQGYRTLLAPQFLTSRNLQERLSESTGSVKPGHIRQIELDHPDGGSLTVTYTTEQLCADDANGAGDRSGERRMPTDEHGRPLELLYGIVSQSRIAVPLDDDDLRRAREDAHRTYDRFLEQEDAFEVAGSDPFSLRSTAIAPRASRQAPPTGPARATLSPDRRALGAPAPKAISADPRPLPPAIPVGWVVLATVAVVGAALLAWLLLRPQPRQVQIVTAAACGPAGEVALTAAIKASPGTVVRYHWIEPAGTTTPTQVRITTATAQSVSTTDFTPVPPSAKFSLAIDSPDAYTRPVPYSGSCAPSR